MSTSPVEGDQAKSWCEKIPEAFYNGPINGSIKYKIAAGNENDHFTIDEDTGEICNEVELDREDIAEYNLLISTFIKNGSDESHISTDRKSSFSSSDHCKDLLLSELCVLIKVEDINDNSPRFQKDIYAIGIYHDISPGTIIIEVTADDDDIGNNSALLYEVEDSLSQFAVHQWSGMIYLTEQINADESSTYELFVKTTDNFGYGLSSPSNTKVKIMTTSIKNTVIITSSLSEMYIKENLQEIISDLQEHLNLDVAILKIGPSLSEDQVMFVDLTDIWFTCTYPQTHGVVLGDHIMENPLTDELKSKWSINATSLGSPERWNSVEPVEASTTATWLIGLVVTLSILLVLAIIFIILVVLSNRQIINPPFFKHVHSPQTVDGPKSKPMDNEHECRKFQGE
ncbi:protocadherin-15-like [Ptychodera flava]|uniref:protocadherin-15-like n=1 Tax=Ptychodera flava TaxID=63121 RepID=UPI00396A561F